MEKGVAIRAVLERARSANTFTGRFEGLPDLLEPLLTDANQRRHGDALHAMQLYRVTLDKIAAGDADAAANYAARLGLLTERLGLIVDRREEWDAGGPEAGPDR